MEIAERHRGIVALLPQLVRWGETSGRSFPWRSERGFRLAVAEVLLQKTRGAAVEQVWGSLLEAYPDARALAAARRSELERIVGPLGLGRQRASRLIAMAQFFCESTTDDRRGLGAYGEGVVRLADGRLPEVAPVDGNVARVLSRVYGWKFERGEPRKKPEVRDAVLSILATPGSENRLSIFYALVDLGAELCRPKRPRCASCPFAGVCWYALGDTTVAAEVRSEARK